MTRAGDHGGFLRKAGLTNHESEDFSSLLDKEAAKTPRAFCDECYKTNPIPYSEMEAQKDKGHEWWDCYDMSNRCPKCGYYVLWKIPRGKEAGGESPPE